MSINYLKQIFGNNIPKESLLLKAHPYTKIIIILFFPILGLITMEFKSLIILIIIYTLLISLYKRNPIKPWFLWIFVILLSYLYYTMSPFYGKNLEIKEILIIPIKVYLLIAPFAQITPSINPFELIQVLPKRIMRMGVIIITFRRYLTVSKQQFTKTREAFRLRNVHIKTSQFEFFITTLISNILLHSKKYADNVEIRNLDNPNHLYDKPIISRIDLILLSFCVISLIIIFIL